MVKEVLHVVTVVIDQLIALFDVLDCYDPNFTIRVDRFAIPVTRVVHVAGWVVTEAPVYVIFSIEFENINKAFARFTGFILPLESTLL